MTDGLPLVWVAIPTAVHGDPTFRVKYGDGEWNVCLFCQAPAHVNVSKTGDSPHFAPLLTPGEWRGVLMPGMMMFGDKAEARFLSAIAGGWACGPRVRASPHFDVVFATVGKFDGAWVVAQVSS